jgi:hypothetical protein
MEGYAIKLGYINSVWLDMVITVDPIYVWNQNEIVLIIVFGTKMKETPNSGLNQTWISHFVNN